MTIMQQFHLKGKKYHFENKNYMISMWSVDNINICNNKKDTKNIDGVLQNLQQIHNFHKQITGAII